MQQGCVPKARARRVGDGIPLFARHIIVNRVGFVKADAVAQFGVEKGGGNLQGESFALFVPLRRTGFGLLHNGGDAVLAQGRVWFCFSYRVQAA